MSPNKLTIDIQTKFFEDSTKIFVMFPGQGYKFHADFETQSAVFFDMPGFSLPKGKKQNDIDFVKHVTMSERIKEWYLEGAKADDLPERNISGIKDYRATKRKIQLAGKIRNFFYEIKKGDIIVAPSKSYDEAVLFGIVEDDGYSLDVLSDEYKNDTIPARKVKWVKKVPRHTVPTWLQRKFSTPTTIQQIENNHYSHVLDIMFDRYFYKEHFVSKFNSTSDDFSAVDSFNFNLFILFITALHGNHNTSNALDLNDKTILSIVSEVTHSSDAPDQRIEIQSPGRIILYGQNLIPLALAIFFALAPEWGFAEDGVLDDIEIINSLDNSTIAKTCNADIKQEVLEDLKMMGYQKWKELCIIKNSVTNSTGLNSKIEISEGS